MSSKRLSITIIVKECLSVSCCCAWLCPLGLRHDVPFPVKRVERKSKVHAVSVDKIIMPSLLASYEKSDEMSIGPR